MAEGNGGLPTTFGAKMLWMLPGTLITLIAAVAISFGILWIVKGQLEKRVDEADNRAKTEEVAIRKAFKEKDDQLAADIATRKKEIEAQALVIEGVKSDITALEKERVPKLIETAKVEVIASTDRKIDTVKTEQAKVDTKLQTDIHENEQRIKYVEEKINKRLVDIESDVKGLKGDTGQLKEEYKALVTEVKHVKEKGEITEKDLLDLTEKSRVFQLRVMAARAREAAEAARKADLEKLLDLLTGN